MNILSIIHEIAVLHFLPTDIENVSIANDRTDQRYAGELIMLKTLGRRCYGSSSHTQNLLMVLDWIIV